MNGLEAVVGQRVRKLRTGCGWTQQELAKRLAREGLDFHQTTVAKLEAATRPIRLNEAATLAAIFGVPLPLLLTPDGVTLTARIPPCRVCGDEPPPGMTCQECHAKGPKFGTEDER